MIAGLLDDDDDGKNLLDATRNLAGAFSDLLKAAQEGGAADSEVRIHQILPVIINVSVTYSMMALESRLILEHASVDNNKLSVTSNFT